MTHRAVSALLALGLLGGCSDPPDLDPGTFRARLSGALSATLSGPSNASTVFIEAFPGPRFAIRMFATTGDTIRAVSVHCAGEGPPAPGTYPITASGAECAGGYTRLVSSIESGTTVLEQAVASSGSLTISETGGDQAVGTFSFSGPFFVGSDPAGTLSVSGAFSADVLP